MVHSKNYLVTAATLFTVLGTVTLLVGLANVLVAGFCNATFSVLVVVCVATREVGAGLIATRGTALLDTGRVFGLFSFVRVVSVFTALTVVEVVFGATLVACGLVVEVVLLFTGLLAAVCLATVGLPVVAGFDTIGLVFGTVDAGLVGALAVGTDLTVEGAVEVAGFSTVVRGFLVTAVAGL